MMAETSIWLIWYKIRKYDVTTGAVTDLHTEDYLNTGYHFTGVTHWTGTTKLIVTKTTSVTSELWTFDTSDFIVDTALQCSLLRVLRSRRKLSCP